MLIEICTLFTLLFCVRADAWNYDDDHIQRMVDVTNRLGLRVLYEHSLLNDNNIAFSPYGLTCVVMAIFEGVERRAAFQVQRSADLPWNAKVTRSGFRDIHKMLQAYFVPEKGFFDGLSFSSDDIVFKPDYLERLKYYGFDVLPNGANNVSEAEPPKTDNKEITKGSEMTTTPSPLGGMPSIGEVMNVDMLSSPVPSVTTTQTMVKETELPKTTTRITTNTPLTTTTESQTVATSATQATVAGETQTAAGEPQTVATSEPQTAMASQTENAQTESIRDVEVINNITEDVTQSTTGLVNAESTPLPAQTTTKEPALETLQKRRKRSMYDYVYNPYQFPILSDDPLDLAVDPSSREYNIGDVTKFLINGEKSTSVDYMVYDSVLEYAEFPQLKSSALKLPLDNDNYYLLIILPDYGVVVDHLMQILAQGYVLRELSHACQPKWVRACVPSFTVKGSIILTRDLQRIGMHDIFEPRQQDFSPMTDTKGVYVRNVEQSVSVTVRKYENNTQAYQYTSEKHPLRFSANYPFLYFVMDSNLHIALIAGKMMDPLNTRIL